MGQWNTTQLLILFLQSNFNPQFDPQSGIKLSLEDGILPAILNTNAVVSGIECKGNFIDIGVPDDYFRAPEILLQ